jgi:FixH.
MNWGHKIILVFIVFACGILTLVIKSMRTRIDMATPDYYAAEIKYQQNIDAQQNAKRLSLPVNISQLADSVEIAFPPEMQDRTLEGSIHFYRPSDSRRDFTLPLHLNEAGKFSVSRSLFIKGSYRIKIQWEADSASFFQETPYYIQ